MRRAGKVTGLRSCVVPTNGDQAVRPTRCQTRLPTSLSPGSPSLPNALVHDRPRRNRDLRRHDERGELETKERRMTITMYDLAGAEVDRRFSPFCWRSKMALAHKGLAVETVPWRFTEKDTLPRPNRGRVPVIIDDDQVVHDSTAIADYLEERYPDRPSLFGGTGGRALTRFVQNWTDTVVLNNLIRLVLVDIHGHLDPADQEYFRQDREKRFGATLEDVVKDREA